jgi:hypothetical protein
LLINLFIAASMIAADTRPLGEEGKEARDVFSDLPSVLATEFMPQSRLPDLKSPVDKFVVRHLRWFHPKTSRPASRRSVLLASGLGFPPMTLDLQ